MIAAILGAGPSIIAHVKQLPDCLMIGVNHHASHVTECDIIVCHDPHSVPRSQKRCGMVVSIHQGLSDLEVPRSLDQGFAAGTAVMFAKWLGCAPILLAGFDCEGAYCDHPDVTADKETELRKWAGVDLTGVFKLGGPIPCAQWS